MRRTIALATAVSLVSLFGWNPTSSATTIATAELLAEEHFSEQGFEVDLYVTRAADGTLLRESTLFDPISGDEVDVWTDGSTVWWDGTIDGRHVSGSMEAVEVGKPNVPQAFCLHPVGAIVCLGILIAVAGGCGAGLGCPPPGTDTNPPGSSGHGGGGDADGDDDGGSDDTGS